MSEVFVVDRAAMFAGRWPQGYQPIAPADRAEFLAQAAAGRFEPRAVAEETPAWKQWIPYCVIRCVEPDPAGEPESPPEPTGVLLVQRTTGQSEARLHGSWSIGLGGHIEPVDGHGKEAQARPESFFLNALRRELEEELVLPADAATVTPQLVGLLNDDATAVGSVHAGLVYVLDLPLPLAAAKASTKVREISKMRGGFGALVELAKLWQTRSQFESWSRFLIHAGVAGPMGDSCAEESNDGSI
ncbi:MAG: NUDIX domain-containing protein [bacterium]|nr:NUDIX domain-containing protein [bacterium]